MNPEAVGYGRKLGVWAALKATSFLATRIAKSIWTDLAFGDGLFHLLNLDFAKAFDL